MSNRLRDEASPYLRQHAENPVDWFPWGEEALALAAEADKPILLSVGYSACHWCHVMAHESFENDEIAAAMNAGFVNIKVDREQRPDIDALYMDAVQAMTGHGGWPMTVFLTPAGQPFFAGTYFPPEPRHGVASFPQILEAVVDAWRNRRDELVAHAGEVTRSLELATQVSPKPGLPDRRLVAQACATLIRGHDPVNGGFGTSPKFPNPLALDVLLRHHLRTGDEDARAVVVRTLDHMAAGGIYDHLGGGFARYSVDERWAVPHFEKMLYDNALLVTAYLHGWQVTGSVDHRQVVAETIEYVLRDLRLHGGGLASAEDADSEGEEGRFYVWTEAELAELLSPSELDIARGWYGVSAVGNFEGANVLHRPEIGRLTRSPEVEDLRRRLLLARSARVRPERDDKVIAEWNCLMISALAEAGAVLDEPVWVDAAEEVMTFLLEHLVDAGGRWYRSWHVDSGRQHLAFAADYAAAVDALTRLGEATGRARWHRLAVETAVVMIELFWDEDGGGLLTTGTDGERLLLDRKELTDNPTPSANSNAAFALLRVAAIHGRADLADRADTILRLVAGAMGTQPLAFSRLLAAFDLATGGTTEIVVAGDRPDLVATAHRAYLPNGVVVFGQPFDSPLWHERTGNRAYVCRNYACELPTDDVEVLARQLGASMS
ncbi:MAG: thioredoxin domain-containing protein [Acidimicrobiia bacterium]|nr:thioredoxin domain-containing protein [Acidimicrobiia bacterium]